MKVSDVMKQAKIIDKDIKLVEAGKIMKNCKISSLIVMERGEIKGVITEDDLVANFGKDEMVYKVMSKNVITISPDKSVNKARELIKENGISILPVVSEKNLVGVVSARDLLIEDSSGDFVLG